MPEAKRIQALEERLAGLESAFRGEAAVRRRVLQDMEERFAEVAKALDVVVASLEDLTPADQYARAPEETGVMGRAVELQALVGIFRNNLEDLRGRLASMR